MEWLKCLQKYSQQYIPGKELSGEWSGSGCRDIWGLRGHSSVVVIQYFCLEINLTKSNVKWGKEKPRGVKIIYTSSLPLWFWFILILFLNFRDFFFLNSFYFWLRLVMGAATWMQLTFFSMWCKGCVGSDSPHGLGDFYMLLQMSQKTGLGGVSDILLALPVSWWAQWEWWKEIQLMERSQGQGCRPSNFLGGGSGLNQALHHRGF